MGFILIKIRGGIDNTVYASLKKVQNQKCIEIVFMWYYICVSYGGEIVICCQLQ